jgi:hypothetical protein
MARRGQPPGLQLGVLVIIAGVHPRNIGAAPPKVNPGTPPAADGRLYKVGIDGIMGAGRADAAGE